MNALGSYNTFLNYLAICEVCMAWRRQNKKLDVSMFVFSAGQLATEFAHLLSPAFANSCIL
jgi:hypothetical protein